MADPHDHYAIRVHPLSMLLRILCAAAAISIASAVSAEDVDGYTEPYRTVNVATGETGVIGKLLVEEGDQVADGQALAKLNSKVHESILRVTKAAMEAEGALKAAEAEFQLRTRRHQKLTQLSVTGYAHTDEVARAKTEMQIAAARLQSAQEEQLSKSLEYEKIRAQLELRTIRAPRPGRVIRVIRQEGELLAPNDPYLLTIAQLDLLKAVFSVSPSQALWLERKHTVPILLTDLQTSVTGVVETISPVIDAESGTVKVELRIANELGEIRSGRRCQLQFESTPGPRPLAMKKSKAQSRASKSLNDKPKAKSQELKAVSAVPAW